MTKRSKRPARPAQQPDDAEALVEDDGAEASGPDNSGGAIDDAPDQEHDAEAPSHRAPEHDDEDDEYEGLLVPAVDVLELEKVYGDLVALSPFTVEIEIGQSVALIGHNGSGKSTFLRMASGLLEPSAGEIEIAGWPVGSTEARATTSYLPDDPVLYDDLSVREHVEYVSRLHGGDGWDEYAESLVERLGLSHRIDDLPSRFSRGLRQKTSLVLGLVRPFSVLLVDEPFVGLDMSGRKALLELFEEVHNDGAATLVATHDPEYVERVDRCIALRDGEVIFDGQATVADVMRLVNA